MIIYDKNVNKKKKLEIPVKSTANVFSTKPILLSDHNFQNKTKK